jgi:hypothetical protein
MSVKFLGAALAAALLCAHAATAAEDCALKQIASLPIATTASGKIAVPVKIGGTNRLMAVELGSATTGINANLIDELKLDTRPIPSADVPANLNNVTMMPASSAFIYSDDVFTQGVLTTIMRKVTLPEFQMGALDIKDLPVTALPGWKNADGIAGILGTALLQHFDVELDFANAKINVYSQDHCAGKVVYWADAYAALPFTINAITGGVMTPMTLDGAPLTVTLSTDPGHGEMSLGVAGKMLGVPVGAPELKHTDHPHPVGGTEWYAYPFKTLSLGGLAIQNPAIDLFAGDDFCTQDKLHGAIYVPAAKDAATLCQSDATIKLAELHQLHLYFAFGEKKLYVTAADARR